MTRQQKSGVFLGLLGLVVFFVTPSQTESEASALYPQILSVLVTVFGVLVALFPGKGTKSKGVTPLNPLLLGYMALVLAAVICIQYIGFYPVMLVAMPLCLYLFGERNLKKMVAFSVIVTGIIYLFIDCILGSMLP